MRILVLTAMTAIAAASPAFAQHKPPPGPTVLARAEPRPTPELCRVIKAPKLISRQTRNHGGSISVIPTWSNGKPLSTAEIKRMLKACDAKSS